MVLFGQSHRARAPVGARATGLWRAWFRRFRVEGHGCRIVIIGAVGLRGGTGFRRAAGAAGRRLYARRPAAATTSVDIAGGAAQKFDIGRDIPGEWWKVFHSRELDGLIAEALQANPSLQAAQAALWQAKENLYAAEGKLMPQIDANASADAPAILAGANSAASAPPFIFNLFQATVNVSYAPDVFGGQRRQIETPGGARRLSALRARGDLSDA